MPDATRTFDKKDASRAQGLTATRAEGGDQMTAANATIRVLACAALCGWGAPSSAQQPDGLMKSVAKVLGFATDVGPPADFVAKSRPKSEPDYIPVFRAPPEPARPVMNAKQFQALKGDLDSVEKRADALRQAYPPSAKAVAEEQAARDKAKSKAPDARQ